jgi:hypothetical protein
VACGHKHLIWGLMMEITEEEFAKKLEDAIAPFKLEIAKMSDKNDELLGEVKGTKRKKAELEEAQRIEAEKKAIENGEYKVVLDNTRKDLEDERTNNQAFRQQIESKNIDIASANIASSVSSDESNRYLLAREIKDYTTVVDGEVKYTIGGVSVDQKTVIDHVKTKFPSLVDGNPATGDNAKRGTGGTGGSATSFKDMSRTERTRLANEDPIKYNQLAGN